MLDKPIDARVETLAETSFTSPVRASTSTLSDEDMDAELEKGYADMLAGRVESAKEVFRSIREDNGL